MQYSATVCDVGQKRITK